MWSDITTHTFLASLQKKAEEKVKEKEKTELKKGRSFTAVVLLHALRFTVQMPHFSQKYVDKRLRLVLLEHRALSLCLFVVCIGPSGCPMTSLQQKGVKAESNRINAPLTYWPLLQHWKQRPPLPWWVLPESRSHATKRQKRCSKDDPCIIALVSASDALNSALTELMTKQSFRVCSCPPPVC